MVLRVLFARLRLHLVARRWWQMLDEGGTRRANAAVLIGVPAAIAVAVLLADLRADSLKSYLTAVTVLAGLLFTLVFQLSDWSQTSSSRLEEHASGHRPLDTAEVALARRRLRLIQRAYADLCWAFLVSIALIVVLAVLGTGEGGTGPLGTALVSLVGAHLVLVLLSALSAAFTVTAADLDQHSP